MPWPDRRATALDQDERVLPCGGGRVFPPCGGEMLDGSPFARRRRNGNAPEGVIFRGVSQHYRFASAFTISRQNAGRSSGFRDVIRFPSTTTS